MPSMARKSPPTMPRALILLIILISFYRSQCEAFAPPMASHTELSFPLWSSSAPSFVDGTAVAVGSASNNDDEADENEEHITTKEFHSTLSLDSIRASLIRQEETIIFALIERAQFRQNDVVYEVGGVPGLSAPPGSVNCKGEDLSFLDFMLTGTEALHSMVRRYESPQEHAFFPSRLPERTTSLQKLEYPSILSSDEALNNVNLNWNKILYDKYLNVIVPAIAAKGDDEQYGSTVTNDIAILQALSKRIHYGKFVAESKYRSDPEQYQRLVDEGDADGVMELLTNALVEERLLTRVRLKAASYGRDPLLSSLPTVEDGEEDNSTSIIAAAAAAAVVAAVEAMKKDDHLKGKMDPAIIESIYRELIIPMTKDIEVAYLFLRCGREPPPEYASDRMSLDVTELSTGNIP